MKVAFKGSSYQEDCGIYISNIMEQYSNTARLYPNGVVIDVKLKDIANVKESLEKELGYKVKTLIEVEKFEANLRKILKDLSAENFENRECALQNYPELSKKILDKLGDAE
jgi:hypothetical protein